VSITPETRYVETPDGVYIAYQAVGDGPVDIALDFNVNESNVDLMWEEPDWAPFLTGIAEFARLIIHDRRGVGVSSRNVPPPNLETRVSDLVAVLDEVGSDRPILGAGRDSGCMHALFAATHPDRVSGLVWNTPAARVAWAPDYPWGQPSEDFHASLQQARSWGTGDQLRRLARLREAERAGVAFDPALYRPSSAEDLVAGSEDDPVRLAAYGKVIRNTATPDVAEQIDRIDFETDVMPLLPSVHAPATLVGVEVDQVEEARYIASLIPNATLHVVSGSSGLAVEPILRVFRNMAGIESAPVAIDTVLSTILFTDIIDSTAKQAAMGDRLWKDLVLAHHSIVRAALSRWRGVENDTAGDGFYATFDGPARAIRCALEISERVRHLGIEVRAGVHTGECEIIDGKSAGITVSIGARVASKAGPSDVLVSQTVKDLVAGSGLTFQDAGEHELKGVPESWRLYRVRA